MSKDPLFHASSRHASDLAAGVSLEGVRPPGSRDLVFIPSLEPSAWLAVIDFFLVNFTRHSLFVAFLSSIFYSGPPSLSRAVLSLFFLFLGPL